MLRVVIEGVGDRALGFVQTVDVRLQSHQPADEVAGHLVIQLRQGADHAGIGADALDPRIPRCNAELGPKLELLAVPLEDPAKLALGRIEERFVVNLAPKFMRIVPDVKLVAKEY